MGINLVGIGIGQGKEELLERIRLTKLMMQNGKKWRETGSVGNIEGTLFDLDGRPLGPK